jgi:Protein of unknown function (DUF3443)
MLLGIAGCGGGAGSGNTITPAADNVAPILVDAGPAATVNIPFVTITICEPGTSNCQTIDHVEVDTGSTGLRLLAPVLNASLKLPQVMDSSNSPLAECIQFADGFSWGSVKTADVKIAGEQASGLRVQVIGDSAFPTVPSDCASGVPENSVQAFGANGLLGVGSFREDCGAFCVTAMGPGTYYSCPLSGCVGATAALAEQLQNLVVFLPVDNNGVIIELPTVDPAGAAVVKGSLVFGIGTQSNNALGSAKVLALDVLGNFTTMYNSQTLNQSFIDSGSNGLFFPDAALPECAGSIAPGYYCPTTAQTFSATIQSTAGGTSEVTFRVANADALLNNNPTFWAFGSIAGPNPIPQSFDFGLPFFYGRNVFVAIEGQSTPAATGPYIAY